MSNKHKDLRYFVRTLSIVVGLVMIWRGVWHVLDKIETIIFGDYDLVIPAIIGIILGVILLYIPDRDLKEIEKL